MDFLQQYTGVIGGLSIALATVIAAYFNYIASRKAERRLKSEATVSHAAAITSELAGRI